jgi:cell division protein FtsQ
MGMPITMGTASRKHTGDSSPGVFSGSSAQRLAAAPARRSNRKSAPPWRERLPSVRAVGGASVRAVRRALPALVAVTVIAAAVALLGLGYRFVTSSPRFAIREIRFEGNTSRPAAELRAYLPVEDGANIFTTHTGKLEAALARHPWLKSARVRRELPSRLIVSVTERTAAALVDLGGLYLVDDAGVPFKRLAGDEGAGLPVVTGLSRDEYLADPTGSSTTIRRALAALRAWDQPGTSGLPRPAIGEVHLGPRHALVLHTADAALSIRLGVEALPSAEPDATDAPSGHGLAERLAVFDQTWAALSPKERRAARVLHLDNATRADHVTVALAPPASASTPSSPTL